MTLRCYNPAGAILRNGLSIAMSSEIQQLHVIVRGYVQGVNFRSSTATVADHLGLSGWVRNQADGSVEVVAEGPRPGLERLLDFLRRGPPAARVTRVEPEWRAATQAFRRFEA